METIFCIYCKTPTHNALGRLLFMRHGETKMNSENRCVGSIDEPMNNVGRAQVREAAKKLKTSGWKIDRIISSPMIRALETANIIGGTLHIAVETDERLRERNVGAIQGQIETSDHTEKLLDDSFLPGDAESLSDFEKHLQSFLDELPTKYAHKATLFVTHGFVMLVMIKLAKGLSKEDALRYKMPKNAEVVEYAVSEPCRTCGSKFFEIA